MTEYMTLTPCNRSPQLKLKLQLQLAATSPAGGPPDSAHHVCEGIMTEEEGIMAEQISAAAVEVKETSLTSFQDAYATQRR
jgi:hypothetical protein